MRVQRLGLVIVSAGVSATTLLACLGGELAFSVPPGADGAADTGSVATHHDGSNDPPSLPGPSIDSGETPPPIFDSSPPVTIVDAGLEDVVAPPIIVPAKVQLVNAATDFGPSDPVGAFRICYQIGNDEAHTLWAPLPPLPNRTMSGRPFPGTFIGTGGAIDATGADLSQLIVIPYLVSGSSLEAKGEGSTVKTGHDKLCEELFDTSAAGVLTLNKDYWKLPVLPVSTFLQQKSYILILTGCAGDSTAGAACGAGFTTGAPGNGTLALTLIEADTTTKIDPDKIGVQFAQMSPTLATKAKPAILSDPANPQTAKLISASDVDYLAHTALTQVPGVVFAADSFTADPAVSTLALPLPQIATASGATYANGLAFTFIALGDTTSFHYLGLPNNPIIHSFDPNK